MYKDLSFSTLRNMMINFHNPKDPEGSPKEIIRGYLRRYWWFMSYIQDLEHDNKLDPGSYDKDIKELKAYLNKNYHEKS